MRKTIAISLASSALGLQAAVFDFSLAGNGGSGLLPSNEIPPITGSTASGSANGPIQYNDSNNQLTFDISFSVPSGATFASIKGPADANTGGADNLYIFHASDYFNGEGAPSGSLTSPGISSPTPLTLVANPNGVPNYSIAQQESDLKAGLWYIEIASNDHAFGEIRGNLTLVPEPGQYAMLTGLALAGYAAIRRKLRR